MPPRLMPDWAPVQSLLFFAICAVLWLAETLTAFVSYLHADRVYADLDRISAECLRLADPAEGDLPQVGSAGGSALCRLRR